MIYKILYDYIVFFFFIYVHDNEFGTYYKCKDIYIWDRHKYKHVINILM